MYSAEVLDHFANARNSGELENADANVCIENPACGDVLHLAIKVADGRIVAARFLARGCVCTVACASKMTEMILGRTLPEAQALRREILVQELGGLPPASVHAAALSVAALAEAVKQAGV